MSESILQQLKGQGQMVMVQMNDVVFHACNDRIPYIGTEHLNGCFVVVIISLATQVALLAHISPRANLENPDDSTAGERHVNNQMDEVIRRYRQHRGNFPDGTVSWTVFARLDGEVALQHLLNIIQSRISPFGFTQTSTSYHVRPAGNTRAAGMGEVFIGIRDHTIGAFIENRRIPLNANTASSAPNPFVSGVIRSLRGTGLSEDEANTLWRECATTVRDRSISRNVNLTPQDLLLLTGQLALQRRDYDAEVAKATIMDIVRNSQR